MANLPLALGNLIQGVSQQAPQQRRPSQCEDQINCINSASEGCVARPSTEFLGYLTAGHSGGEGEGDILGGSHGAFFYEIERADERYLVAIKPGAETSGGEDLPNIRVFNIGGDAPVVATVTISGGSEDYLFVDTDAIPPVLIQDCFAVATVDDFFFVVNKTIIPEMDEATRSPSRPNEAIFHFKAGNYSTTYRIAITHDSTVHTYTYKTPDNSVETNADYITTNHLAATFFRAMSGGETGSQAGSGGGYTEPPGALGQHHAGAGGTVGGAPEDLTTHGFNLSINGNAVHIWHDTDTFKIDVDDGLSNNNLIAFQDVVQNFNKLPATGFEGYTVLVRGDARQEQDDYYVRYTGSTGALGTWKESVASDISIAFAASTMPHQLVNVGLNQFTFGPAPWGQRVVGDEESDPEPSFVGARIEDIFRNNGRLGIMTEGTISWSKTRNPYVFFKKTVQTEVDDDPIDFEVSGPKLALLRRGVVSNEAVALWALDQQFSIRKQDQPFAARSIEIKPSTSYEFAPRAKPCAVGQSLYFASEEDPANPEDAGEESGFATIRDLSYQDERAIGDTDVTAHVSKYIPRGVHHISASDTRSMMAVLTRGESLSIFLYNFYTNGQERLQSAWNKWRFPYNGRPLWCSLSRSILRGVYQLPGNSRAFLARMVLSPDYTDPGGDYHTRLDLRVHEAQLSCAYDAETGRTTITFPYAVEDDVEDLIIVCRETSLDENGPSRGQKFPPLADTADGFDVQVEGDLTEVKLYAGFPIESRLTFSTPYTRDDDGVIPIERLQVKSLKVMHHETGYYRVETEYEGRGDAEKKAVEFIQRVLGADNETDVVPIHTGSHEAAILGENDRIRVSLINDSFLPSKWQTAQWTYAGTERNARGGGRR